MNVLPIRPGPKFTARHLLKGSIPIAVMDVAFGDGELCVTIKKSMPKIVANLIRIADSFDMLKLAELLA